MDTMLGFAGLVLFTLGAGALAVLVDWLLRAAFRLIRPAGAARHTAALVAYDIYAATQLQRLLGRADGESGSTAMKSEPQEAPVRFRRPFAPGRPSSARRAVLLPVARSTGAIAGPRRAA